MIGLIHLQPYSTCVDQSTSTFLKFCSSIMQLAYTKASLLG